MPHRCTTCNNIIEDGSESLFSGCPSCSGNGSWEYVEASNQEKTQSESDEDQSQKKARSEFVSTDELPTDSSVDVLQSPTIDQNSENNIERVDEVEKIRQRLNSQYEGIRVEDTGHYKINLTELYRGHDYIIEIGDDGAYEVKEL